MALTRSGTIDDGELLGPVWAMACIGFPLRVEPFACHLVPSEGETRTYWCWQMAAGSRLGASTRFIFLTSPSMSTRFGRLRSMSTPASVVVRLLLSDGQMLKPEIWFSFRMSLALLRSKLIRDVFVSLSYRLSLNCFLCRVFRWLRQLTITPSDHKSIKDRSLQIFVDSSFWR